MVIIQLTDDKETCQKAKRNCQTWNNKEFGLGGIKRCHYIIV